MMKTGNLLLLALATASLLACEKRNEFVAPPPPEVGVQKPVMKVPEVYSEYAGRTSGSSRVEIRARVKGFLLDSHFDAGQYVEEGDLLFTIEPEQFDAAVVMAKGNLAKAQADLRIATTEWEKRVQANKASNGAAVSEIEVLNAEAKMEAAKATVDIADAELANANRDKEYTEIHAPVSGRVSSSLIDKGNLVGAADPTLLTDIITVNPIYFNFEVSEREVLQYLANMPNAENPTGSGKGKELELELVLSDGTVFGETGRFDFVNNSIDPSSGTLRARAVFDNADGLLVDGLFARIRIPVQFDKEEEGKEPTPLPHIPASAIQRDLGGSFVLLVNEENVVERRPIVVTPFSTEGMRIIEPYDEEKGTGLRDSDQFVVSNIQRAREGITVRPSEKRDAPKGESPEKEAQQQPAGGKGE